MDVWSTLFTAGGARASFNRLRLFLSVIRTRNSKIEVVFWGCYKLTYCVIRIIIKTVTSYFMHESIDCK